MRNGTAQTVISLCGLGGGMVYLSSLGPTAMRESPLQAFQYKSELKSTNFLLKCSEISKLNKDGIVVIDNILNIAQLKAINDDIDTILFEDETKTPSQKSFEANGHENSEVRNDLVYFASQPLKKFQIINKNEGISDVIRILRSIPYELTCHTTTVNVHPDDLGVPLSNQLSCYDGCNGKYIAHRDRLIYDKHDSLLRTVQHYLRPGIQDREFTIILYLNGSSWDSNAGGLQCSGNLRCFLNAKSDDETGETATQILDIEPIGGRLVIFNSRTILHEVLPTAQHRRAFTCWVGGKHSKYEWIRPFCIPTNEIDWKYMIPKF